jgi:hypothetical protein
LGNRAEAAAEIDFANLQGGLQKCAGFFHALVGEDSGDVLTGFAAEYTTEIAVVPVRGLAAWTIVQSFSKSSCP